MTTKQWAARLGVEAKVIRSWIGKAIPEESVFRAPGGRPSIFIEPAALYRGARLHGVTEAGNDRRASDDGLHSHAATTSTPDTSEPIESIKEDLANERGAHALTDAALNRALEDRERAERRIRVLTQTLRILLAHLEDEGTDVGVLLDRIGRVTQPDS